jgi:hypothetical protein
MDPVLSTVMVAVIVAGGTILNSVLSGRQRRREKQEDYARQDKVAAQAAEAARLLVARQDDSDRKRAQEASDLRAAQEKTIQGTERVAALAAKTATSVDQQLERIHTLVNSDMTAARANELDGARLTLAALLKIIALDRDAGREPTAEDLALIEATEARIVELEQILADRHAQQQAVEQQARDAKGRP